MERGEPNIETDVCTPILTMTHTSQTCEGKHVTDLLNQSDVSK